MGCKGFFSNDWIKLGARYYFLRSEWILTPHLHSLATRPQTPHTKRSNRDLSQWESWDLHHDNASTFNLEVCGVDLLNWAEWALWITRKKCFHPISPLMYHLLRCTITCTWRGIMSRVRISMTCLSKLPSRWILCHYWWLLVKKEYRRLFCLIIGVHEPWTFIYVKKNFLDLSKTAWPTLFYVILLITFLWHIARDKLQRCFRQFWQGDRKKPNLTVYAMW